MQNNTLRTAVGIILLLIAAAFVYLYQIPGFDKRATSNDSAFHYISDLTIWRRTKGEQNLLANVAVDLDHDLRDIPLKMGAWQGQEIEQNNVTALIMLQPEQFIERYYEHENGQYLWLTMIGGRQSRTFHAPEICYDSYGWDTNLSYEAIPLTEGNVQGILVDANKEATETEAAAQHLSFYFYLFPDPSRDPDAGIIMFRTTTPRYGTNEETMALHSDFLAHFFTGGDFAEKDAPSIPHFQSIDAEPIAAGLKLDGYHLSQQQIPSGTILGVDLSWLTLKQPTATYLYDVWVSDANGVIWSQKETFRSHIFEEPPPTHLWEPGQKIWDSREVTLLPGTPPGQYDIVVTLYDKETTQPATFTAESGEIVGPYPIIGQITVVEPDFPVHFQPQAWIEQEVADTGLTLLGYLSDRTAIATGDLFPLTLFWEKTNHESRPTELILQLKDMADQVAQEWTLPAVRADYPATLWQIGDKLRGQHNLRLNAALANGEYKFYLNDIPLMDLTINTPERLFQKPPYDTDVGVSFANQISLVGYTLSSTDELELIWQANSGNLNNYHVFVHVLNEAGEIVMQSDGVPVMWTRPSTGWIIDEYIVDSHILALPDEETAVSLTLHVGLYQPDSGERLQTESGQTFVTFPFLMK